MKQIKVDKHRRRVYLALTAGLLLLLAVTAAFLLRSSRINRSDQLLQRAREAYATGDCEGALALLRRMDTEDQEMLMLSADCYEALGNYERALGILRQLNTSDPTVSSRIQEIEAARAIADQAESFSLGSKELRSGDRSAVLDGIGLTDEDIAPLADLYSLETLSLRRNMLSDLSALSALGGLRELDVSDNRVRNLTPLSGLKNLRSLTLDRNPIEDCQPLSGLVNLQNLSMIGTGMEKESLYDLARSIPTCAIRCEIEGIESVLFGEEIWPVDIEELDLSGRGLRDLGFLRQMKGLRFLNLSHNELVDLHPLMDFAKLEQLDLSFNELTDLRPLIGLPSLSVLRVSHNEVPETASVGSIAGLKSLDLSYNPVSDFSGLSKLTGLHTLMLCDTRISDMDLPELYSLRSLANLDLTGNEGLSDVAVGQLRSQLPSCVISTSELVYEVSFCGHLVRSDERKLSYAGSGISDLHGLSQMMRLEELDLSRNAIVSLYQFEISPSRNTLRRLDLSNNAIRDASSLRALTALEELNLSGNQLDNVLGLESIATLKWLDLRNNPLDEGTVNRLREQMPDCEILSGG